jgi:four helix bundle protein
MQNGNWKKEFLERLIRFSSDIVILTNSFPKTPAGYALASQLVRSGTSVGANVHEAQDASSGKDFRQKMLISLREARETYYWFEVVEVSGLLSKKELSKLKHEVSEIIAILVSILNKLKNKE